MISLAYAVSFRRARDVRPRGCVPRARQSAAKCTDRFCSRGPCRARPERPLWNPCRWCPGIWTTVEGRVRSRAPGAVHAVQAQIHMEEAQAVRWASTSRTFEMTCAWPSHYLKAARLSAGPGLGVPRSIPALFARFFQPGSPYTPHPARGQQQDRRAGVVGGVISASTSARKARQA